MSINYLFNNGDRVQHRYAGKCGEVTSCVPGNGTIPWYFVAWDDGTEDRHTAEELYPA